MNPCTAQCFTKNALLKPRNPTILAGGLFSEWTALNSPSIFHSNPSTLALTAFSPPFTVGSEPLPF